jgi:hypothetical protein
LAEISGRYVNERISANKQKHDAVKKHINSFWKN